MKKNVDSTGKKARKVVHGFKVLENECIWMKAGVVNYRRCDNGFDCNGCPFDAAMRKAMGVEESTPSKQAAPRWVDYLQQKYYGASRPCRHALTGRIDAPKICTMNYECFHCAFDQMLDEMDLAHEIEPPDLISVSGYRMARGYYYHMGHSWSRFEHGGRTRIGMDQFSTKVFGPATSVDLPDLGEDVQQHKVGWAFYRDSHEAGVLSPVSGTVLAVNHAAREHPEIVHQDPYNNGWLVIVEPAMPKRNVKGLYFGQESVQWMENESQRLLSLMGPEYEDMAATGAEPVSDLFGNYPELDWPMLVETFLHTKVKKPMLRRIFKDILT
jgi:glycine cleavage system H lipoate-binding protein